MTITRIQLLLALAAGLLFGGLNAATALAQANLQPKHTAEHGSHAGKHDHDAMKTEKEIGKSLAALSEADHKQAVAQRYCPIMQYTRLGADGTPQKVMIGAASVLVCCEGCIEPAEAGGKATLATAEKLRKATAAMAKMPAKERAAAEAQKYCVIANKNLLGLMGAPIKLEFGGEAVYLCCKGCVNKANADPAAALAKAKSLKKAGEDEGHEHDSHDHKGHEHGDHKR